MLSLPASPAEKLAWLAARFQSGAFKSPTEAALVAALVCCHNTKTGLICPGADTLAGYVGASIRAAEAGLRDLAAGGLVKRQRRFGKPTLYGLAGLGEGEAAVVAVPANPAETGGEDGAAFRQTLPERSGEICRTDPADSAGHNLRIQPVKFEPGRGAAGICDFGDLGATWSRVLAELEGEIAGGAVAVRQWLAGCVLVELDRAEGRATLQAGNRNAAAWVAGRYDLALKRAFKALGLGDLVFDVVCADGAPRHGAGASSPALTPAPAAPATGKAAPPRRGGWTPRLVAANRGA